MSLMRNELLFGDSYFIFILDPFEDPADQSRTLSCRHVGLFSRPELSRDPKRNVDKLYRSNCLSKYASI